MAEAVRKLKYFSQEEADRYWPEMIEKYEMDMISLKQQYKEEGTYLDSESNLLALIKLRIEDKLFIAKIWGNKQLCFL